MIELVLQRPCTGRENHAAPRHERRNEVGERLAGTGARLDDQCLTALERGGHVLRHLDLLVAYGVPRQRARKRARGAEDLGEVRTHSLQRNFARNRSSAVAPGASGRRSFHRKWE